MIRFFTIDPGNYSVKDLGVAIVDAINKKQQRFFAAPGTEYLVSNNVVITSRLEFALKDTTSNKTFEIYTDGQLEKIFANAPKDTRNALLNNP